MIQKDTVACKADNKQIVRIVGQFTFAHTGKVAYIFCDLLLLFGLTAALIQRYPLRIIPQIDKLLPVMLLKAAVSGKRKQVGFCFSVKGKFKNTALGIGRCRIVHRNGL